MTSANYQTLGELFLQATEGSRKPDVFLTKSAGQYRGTSSADALAQAAAFARALDRMGVRAGDRIALLAENRLEWALSDYAILGLGAITVPLYATLLEEDVEYVLHDSSAKGIVVSTEDQLRKVLAIRSKLPDLTFSIVMDSKAEGTESVHGWKEMVRPGLAEEEASVDFFRGRARAALPEDPATLVYTSGTTGAYKGVVLSHANIISNIRACSSLFDLGTRDTGVSLLPLAHIFERMLDFYYLARGISIAYTESYDSLPRNLLEVRPTVMAVVPRVVEKIRERILEEVQRLPASKQKLFGWAVRTGRRYYPCQLEGRKVPAFLSLKWAVADRLVFAKIRGQLGGRFRMLISGAAPLSRELAEFFFAIGIPVYEGYGLTETSPVIAVNCAGAVKLGTVGRQIPGVEVRLGEEAVDPEGRTGREILVRGPNVTRGYYHPDAQNGGAFAGGWFRTGDLGSLDEDGFLTITGRKKNLFKTSGGKYVSPEKLENLFQGHPYVAQIVVLGDSRKFIGALLVPNFAALESYARAQGIAAGSREELAAHPQLRAFIQQQVDHACQHLAPHERIRQIVLLTRELTIAAGELSATLKVRRPVVEERYRDLIEEMFTRRPSSAHKPPLICI